MKQLLVRFLKGLLKLLGVEIPDGNQVQPGQSVVSEETKGKVVQEIQKQQEQKTLSIEETVKPKRTRKAQTFYVSQDVRSALEIYAIDLNLFSRGKPNISMALEIALRKYFGMTGKDESERP